MSAELLRRAATILRERAEAATPGGWIPFGNNIGATVDKCTCSPIRDPYEMHQNYCGIEGPIVQACNSDADYIATMHPGVGLALADWLDIAGADLWAHGPLCECTTGCDACDDNLWEPHARAALAVARLIVGESND